MNKEMDVIIHPEDLDVENPHEFMVNDVRDAMKNCGVEVLYNHTSDTYYLVQ